MRTVLRRNATKPQPASMNLFFRFLATSAFFLVVKTQDPSGPSDPTVSETPLPPTYCDVVNQGIQCNGGTLASLSDAMAARDAYCDGPWATDACYVSSAGVSIQFSNPGSNTQQICLNALEAIITACKMGRGTDQVFFETGVYNYNYTQYGMVFCTGTPCS